MASLKRACLLAAVLTIATAPGWAQQAAPALSGFDQFAAEQAANNSKSGARQRPAETIPVPTNEVSPAVQALIANPFPPHMNANPQNAAEWKQRG